MRFAIVIFSILVIGLLIAAGIQDWLDHRRRDQWYDPHFERDMQRLGELLELEASL